MPAFLLALAPVWNVTKGVIAALWGFVSRPPGLYVALVALALLTIWGSGERGYRLGTAQGKADCEAAHTAATAAEQARQLQAGTGAVDASERRTNLAHGQDSSNQEIVTDVKIRAQNLPPAPGICPPGVPSILADRLRSLQ